MGLQLKGIQEWSGKGMGHFYMETGNLAYRTTPTRSVPLFGKEASEKLIG